MMTAAVRGLPLAVLLMAAIMSACGGDSIVRDEPAAREGPGGGMAAAQFSTAEQAPTAAAVAPGATPAAFWSARKLIRSAEMRIQVGSVVTALRLADSIAQGQQTMVADSRTSQDDDGRRSADLVIRVPSERFPALLTSLRTLGSVQSESVNAQDVTKEYADVETRLAVKTQTVTRLRGLLESRTAKLSDVLEVERELARAVEELEQLKGEQRYYDQQIALSTVRLSLFESVPPQANQFTKPIAEALRGSMGVMGASVSSIIYLVTAILPWLVGGLFVFWLVRRFGWRVLGGGSRTPPPSS